MEGPKELWGSRFGAVLAVAGSAVGLGNFLRFPGQAAQNGGGAFMIPYFCALILLGIPVCWAEWTMGKYGGQRGRHSCPAILEVLGGRRGWRYVGIVGIVVPVIIYMYYVVIEAWCLHYALDYLTGAIDLGSDPTRFSELSQQTFARVTGANADGAIFGAQGFKTLAVVVVVVGLNFVLVVRGLSKGIERFCSIALPMMAVCAFIVLARVLTLGTPNPAFPERNVLNGLGFMWNPKAVGAGGSWLQSLANPQIWMAAAGQVFFSLSVGFGIIINYASYLRRNDDVVLAGLAANATNEFFEVCLGGLITITAAFVFLGAQGTVGGTFGLGFNTLPVVFEYMPGGRVFGFLWFFMLFLAAITSSISMLQPALAFVQEGLYIERRRAATLLGVITVGGSLFVLYFSKGLIALDTLDFWAGTFLIFVLATIEVVLFAWVFGARKGVEFAEQGAEMRLPKPYTFVIRYITPVYLFIVFAMWCMQSLPQYARSLARGGVPLAALGVIASVGVLSFLVLRSAGRRWDEDAARGRL